MERMRVEAARYDLFVLSYHGGREYAREPERAKVRFFRRLVEAGVDIVWGHHPHVVQGYALVERPEGRGLALYSAGNFISGMTWGIDPEAPEAERAWTGDSALWVVSVALAAGRAGGRGGLAGADHQRARPGGNHGREHVSGPGGAGRPGSWREPWTGYFRERSRQLGARLREWEQEAVDPR